MVHKLCINNIFKDLTKKRKLRNVLKFAIIGVLKHSLLRSRCSTARLSSLGASPDNKRQYLLISEYRIQKEEIPESHVVSCFAQAFVLQIERLVEKQPENLNKGTCTAGSKEGNDEEDLKLAILLIKKDGILLQSHKTAIGHAVLHVTEFIVLHKTRFCEFYF